MKDRLSTAIAFAFLASCICAGVACAQGMGGPPLGPGMMGGPGPMMGPPGGMMGGPGGPLPGPMMMVLRAANLTIAQQKQIDQFMEGSRQTAEPLFKQMHSIREQISDKLLSSGNVTATDLAPLLAQQSKIQEQLDSQMVTTAIEVRGVLTPDQLARVASANDKLKQIHAQIESVLGPLDAPPAP